MPTAFAIIEAVQWVASTGGSVRVSATTRSAISDPVVEYARVVFYRAGGRRNQPA